MLTDQANMFPMFLVASLLHPHASACVLRCRIGSTFDCRGPLYRRIIVEAQCFVRGFMEGCVTNLIAGLAVSRNEGIYTWALDHTNRACVALYHSTNQFVHSLKLKNRAILLQRRIRYFGKPIAHVAQRQATD